MPILDPSKAAAVAERLNMLYAELLGIEQQAHLQEHWLECAGWKGLSKAFDCIEDRGHRELIHPLMKRINALGAKCSKTYRFEPADPADAAEIESAYRSMSDRLSVAHALLVAACEIAEGVDDYASESLLWRMQEKIEHFIRKMDKRIAKIGAVGIQEYLSENMD